MNSDIIYEKRKLRKELRKIYSELSPDYISESNSGIFLNLSTLPEFLSAKVIFSYYSIENEPDTHKIIEYALKMGKTVAVPFCHGGGIMDAVQINSLEELTPGVYNIPAPLSNGKIISPDNIDFAIIPALAYDAEGYRLGQGGGYYDRFLKMRSFFSAGIIRSRFFLDKLPYEQHDVRLSCIITEKVIARLI